MPKPFTALDGIALHQLGDAAILFINHLPAVDPEALSEHYRAGFNASIERVHNEIHAYLQRAATAAQTNTHSHGS